MFSFCFLTSYLLFFPPFFLFFPHSSHASHQFPHHTSPLPPISFFSCPLPLPTAFPFFVRFIFSYITAPFLLLPLLQTPTHTCELSHGFILYRLAIPSLAQTQNIKHKQTNTPIPTLMRNIISPTLQPTARKTLSSPPPTTHTPSRHDDDYTLLLHPIFSIHFFYHYLSLSPT